MLSLKTLLQLPCGWQYSQQVISPDGITLHLRAKRKTSLCPECLKRSDSVHSCRRRRIQHLPCSGQALWLVFAVRHWYCRNPACSRKIFAESLAPFAGSRQQSSQALQNLQRQLGLIAGGRQRQQVSVAVQILFFAGLSIPRRRNRQARPMSVSTSGRGIGATVTAR